MLKSLTEGRGDEEWRMGGGWKGAKCEGVAEVMRKRRRGEEEQWEEAKKREQEKTNMDVSSKREG